MQAEITYFSGTLQRTNETVKYTVTQMLRRLASETPVLSLSTQARLSLMFSEDVPEKGCHGRG